MNQDTTERDPLLIVWGVNLKYNSLLTQESPSLTHVACKTSNVPAFHDRIVQISLNCRCLSGAASKSQKCKSREIRSLIDCVIVIRSNVFDKRSPGNVSFCTKQELFYNLVNKSSIVKLHSSWHSYGKLWVVKAGNLQRNPQKVQIKAES